MSTHNDRQPRPSCAPRSGDDASSGAPTPDAFGGPHTRRTVLLLGLAALAGCASGERVGALPDPVWPASRPSIDPLPAPAPAPGPVRASPPSPFPNVVPRVKWARGNPVPSMMNPMPKVTAITIHHDGMPPFAATDAQSSAARVELIRTSHRNRPQPWGDIGYHFVVDRAGRIYEGRPIQWQGAHVKDYNPGNIGILCLGNFEVQSPSEAQLQALIAHVRIVRRHYNVAANRVLTHREWPGARTACPGIRLQPRVESMRSNRAFV